MPNKDQTGSEGMASASGNSRRGQNANQETMANEEPLFGKFRKRLCSGQKQSQGKGRGRGRGKGNGRCGR